MKSIRFLLLVCIAALCLGKWEDPATLFESKGKIVYHSAYVDVSTSKSHIVFAEELRGETTLYYASIKSTGEKTTPVPLTKQVQHNEKDPAKIIGAGNGKNLYVVVVLKRKTVSDLYFIESGDDGATWSKPIIPRANNLDDSKQRLVPSIFYLKTGRLFVFYNRIGDDMFTVTRPQGSVTWNPEQDISIPECPTNSEIKAMSPSIEVKSTYQYTLFISFRCTVAGKNKLMMAESKNNGISWKAYVHPDYEPQENPSPIISASSYANQYIYGAVKEVSESKTFERATIYQYITGGTFREALSFPLQAINRHNIELCNLDSIPTLIYFATKKSYTKGNERASLAIIPITELWKQKTLPLPYLGSASEDVIVTCFANELIAIGTAGSTKLVASKYSFSETNTQ